jgi:hypothetical protein
MPIKGLVDPAYHRICRRCRKWFEPEEGVVVAREVNGPFGAMRSLRAGLTGSDSEAQFQCHRCTKVRRIIKVTIWSMFFGFVALCLILERVGVLARK